MVREVAADRGVIAELLVLDHLLTSADGVEEVGLMVHQIAITLGGSENLRRFVDVNRRQRMLGRELRQIFVSQLLWPAIDRVAFRLGASVLRSEGQGRALDAQRPLGAEKPDVIA